MYIPLLGSKVPRRGSRLVEAIGRLVLRVCRWRIAGQLPNQPRFISVVAPHTSLWDFLTAIATMLAIGYHGHFLMAAGYFWWPLGSFLRWFGGVPVNQSARQDLVAQLVTRFNEHDRFILALFPEGHRRKMSRWKTGFLHIAAGAKLPYQLVSLDYRKRMTIFGPVLETSGDVDADLAAVRSHFQGATGKHPNLFDTGQE